MHCKDCKHRQTVKQRDSLPASICINDKYISEDIGQTDTIDMMIYSYSECGVFYVGDKFGCVHFEAKDK